MEKDLREGKRLVRFFFSCEKKEGGEKRKERSSAHLFSYPEGERLGEGRVDLSAALF